MANVMDYLAWRGDITLAERPFNEVDNLILAELAYAEMENIVPGPETEATVTLAEAARTYRERGYQSVLINDPGPLLSAAGTCARFADVRLGRYVNRVEVENQVQFSAVTFFLPIGALYVAYRGTDDSIVGWREDFNFSFTQTQGQVQAAAYLDQTAASCPGNIWVGGHSKGGNLAMYAASFCSPAVQARILHIYSNDGPGFYRAVTDTAGYRAVAGRATQMIPESSLIGILLSNTIERRVVKSSASGVMQHNPLTWETSADRLVPSEGQSPASLFADEALGRWVEGLNAAQRENLVSAIFDALDASGAVTLTQMHENRWASCNAVLKAALEMEPSRKRDVFRTLLKLGSAGRDVLRQEARGALEQWIRRAAEQLQRRRLD